MLNQFMQDNLAIILIAMTILLVLLIIYLCYISKTQ